MGATAVLVGFRHKIERKQVQGQTDECLVADVRAGDDTAFEAIYDRYARGVLAFCVHMLGSYEAAEDALQLTFVSAYRALRTGDREISLRPWLYTIARNRCLSELRSRRDADDIDLIAIDRPLPDGLADQVQRREELREMVEDMQRLPADQRAALVLFELGDHSHNEIAAVLGVRREKVKALIFQAREGLVRGRHARSRPCPEIREQLATLEEKVPPRSVTRAHVDRCPSCAAFEHEVHRQRAALALILPVIPAGELKATVLGAAVSGGGAAAVGVGGSGAIVAGGTTAAGAGTAAAGNAGAIAVGSGATGSLASGGGGAAGAAVVAAAPMSTVATGLTAVGADYAVGGVGGIGAGGVVAKILTAAMIATGAVGVGHVGVPRPQAAPSSASLLAVQMPSATPAPPAPILASANLGTPAGTPTPGTAAANTLPLLAPTSAGTPLTTVAIVPASIGSIAGPLTLTATTTSPTTGGQRISSVAITSSLSPISSVQTPIKGPATATNDQSSTPPSSGAPSPSPPASETGAASAPQTAAGSPVASDATIVNQATPEPSTADPTPEASTADPTPDAGTTAPTSGDDAASDAAASSSAPTDSGGGAATADAAASFSAPPASGSATATPSDASASTSAPPQTMSADVPVNADSPGASSSC